MTAAKTAKAMGLKSLVRASEITGQAVSTLDDWSKLKPKLFRTVILGCIQHDINIGGNTNNHKQD